MNSAKPPPTHLLYGAHRNDPTYGNGTEMLLVKNSAGRGFDISI